MKLDFIWEAQETLLPQKHGTKSNHIIEKWSGKCSLLYHTESTFPLRVKGNDEQDQ